MFADPRRAIRKCRRVLEIENYIHPDAITATRPDLTLKYSDTDDVPAMVAQMIHSASESPNAWEDLDEEKKKKKVSNAKQWLNRDADVDTVRGYGSCAKGKDATLTECRRQHVPFSYGGILYQRLRNAWVHELLQDDEDIRAFDETDLSEEPHYRKLIKSPYFAIPSVLINSSGPPVTGS